MNQEKTQSKINLKVAEVEILPIVKIAKIAMKGIKIRIWRSLLVLLCIALATAFLSYILTADAFQKNLKEHASKQLLEKLIRIGTFNQENIENQRVQTYWILALSVIISFVGIVNAMLMSVSERFREIGTMKCLGALDSFVLKLFMIESAVIGSAGTVAGFCLGTLLAFIEGFYIYGIETFSILNLSVFFVISFISISTGIIITVLGALYPAYQASKMKPVVALRAEV